MSSPLKSAVFISVSSLPLSSHPSAGFAASALPQQQTQGLFPSLNFRAIGDHARGGECLWDFAFACQREFRKLLVPLFGWELRIRAQPVLQCVEIINRNPPFTRAINQMLHEVGRRLPNFRHSGTVYGTQSFEVLRSGDGVRFRPWHP